MRTAPEIVRLASSSDLPDLFFALLGAFSVGDAFVGIYDDSDYLRYANDGFLQAFNLRGGEVATFASIILDAARDKKGVRIEAADPHAFIAEVQMRRRILPRAPSQRSFPVDFVNGRWFWCTETLLANGWIVLSGADITSLKRTEAELKIARDRALLLSRIDELTDVPNRRFALSMLDALLLEVNLRKTELSVALLDLDHFKSINDTFGHEAGDKVLRHFAKYCVSSLRKVDLVGRLGGEEFLVLLPGTSPEHAKDVLQGMLSSAPKLVLGECPAEIAVSFSAGVTLTRPGERREDVLARADKALYVAKRAGRSRVEVGMPFQISIER